MPVSRGAIGKILRAAGIEEYDERYPLRCTKCRQHGHTAAGCSTGDALDQLDRKEGWVRDRKLTADQYGKMKQAHYQYQVPAASLRINYPGWSTEQIEHVLKSKNYEAWLADPK